MPGLVTIAIPVRNGGPLLGGVLEAVAAQQLERPVELLVADSSSTDGSRELALAHGARVLDINPATFSHGGTRNLMVEQARGEHVVFLTQDAEPADPGWLDRLLQGFAVAPDVALVCGPYRPRPHAPLPVARELDGWFASLAPDGRPRVDRLAPEERGTSALELVGRRGFFTDANGAVLRAAWERVPFRPVDYAEDQALAVDMLRAGYAKVFVPDAAVLHSHDYSLPDWFRRAFDEWRALRGVFGHVHPATPRETVLRLRGELGADWRALGDSDAGPVERARVMAWASAYHGARHAGAAAGARAGRLPTAVRRRWSLEGRADP